MLYPALSLTYDLHLSIGAVDDGAQLRVALAAIDDEIYAVAILLVDQFGLSHILDIFVFAHLETGREQRCAQRFAYLANNAVVRDTYTYLLAILEYLGKAVSCGENKGEGARQMVAHEAEGIIVDAHIFAHAPDIVCYYREQVVFGVESLDFAHALNGPFLQGMAAKGIGGVGGVDDDSAIIQDVDYAVDIAARVVLCVEFQ